MKYTVIGHFSIDVRHTADGDEHRTFAGILNAVRALASLAPDDTVCPVFGVGERDYFGVKTLLAAFPNVDIAGIYSYRGESNEVHYYPSEGGTVTACAKKIAPAIPFAKIEPFLNGGGILINMISGSDITLDTLDEIRMAVRAKGTPIHIDLHNLTLGVNADATRFRRPISDWRRWCFMITSVQMNEAEAAGLTLEYTDLGHLVKQMVPLMVQALVVTRGERGATVYESQHKSSTAHEIEGMPAPEGTDTVGCGDVFGAAFLYRYCAVKQFAEAGAFANRAAAVSAAAGSEGRYAALAQLKVPQ